MNKKSLFFFAGAALVYGLCSCSSFEPTMNLEQALADVENKIEYHDRAYMEKRPVDKGMIAPDIKKIGKLNFMFAFEQGNSGENNANVLQKNVWDAFRREFETAISGSRRFPAATIRYARADKELRSAAHAGTVKMAHFDPSELKNTDGLINLTPMLSNSSSVKGNQRTTTYTFQMSCSPVDPKNNAPLPDFQSYDLKVYSDIKTLTDRFGRTKVGLRFDDLRAGAGANRLFEDFQLRQGRAMIVNFFVDMYKKFPVGGEVVNFDEDGRALIKANRACGLLKNMECVIFARKRNDEYAIPVPLYNATVTLLSQTGNSTLQIWRKSEKNSAQKIIKLIETDIEEARAGYEFFACSDGFPEWPDFVQKQNRDGK